MKKYLLSSSFFFLLCIRCVFACINEYYPTSPPLLQGKLELNYILNPKADERPYWKYGMDGAILLNLHQREIALRRTGLDKLDYQSLSDYASIELKIGDRENALHLLDSLYQKHPGEYNIVANLGTAYEVMGNDSMALRLLKKAVEINPKSHHGSEWIHIKILEQKLAAQPDYTKIINLGVTDFASWLKNDNYVFPQHPDSLKIQIAYQLHERIFFIPPPNPVVAQLVLDFADIVAKHDGHAAAIPFYEYAAVYGKDNLNTIITNRKEISAQTKRDIETTFRRAAIIWAVPLLAFVLIFIAWLRSRKKV